MNGDLDKTGMEGALKMKCDCDLQTQSLLKQASKQEVYEFSPSKLIIKGHITLKLVSIFSYTK